MYNYTLTKPRYYRKGRVWPAPPVNSVLYLPGFPPVGSTIRDFSGQGNDGTITGAVWTRLPSGLWYLDFDGTDDEVAFTGISITTEDFSGLCWVNPDVGSYSGRRNSIFGGAAQSFLWRTQINTGTQYISKTDVADSPVSSTALTVDKWQLAGFVFDSTATTNNLTFYLNGTADGTVTFNQDFGASITFYGRGKTAATNADLKGSGALPRLLLNTKLTAAQMAGFYNQERHLFGV